MAVGWMSALKLVPWGDVIEATPKILQAARRLMGSTKKVPASAPPPDGHLTADSATPPVQEMQLHLLALEEEQRASAALIQSLAEQNAQLVRAIETLRVRQRRLLAAAWISGLATLGLWVWVWTR